MDLNKIYCMDCLDGLKQLSDDSIDLLITDPPYGLSFMGKDWDKAVPSIDVWKRCLQVLKPGSFAFVMCIPRQDCLSRMIINLGDAGFRTDFTSIYWTYSTGFPKASNISKLVDKRLGAERKVIGNYKARGYSEVSPTEDGRNMWAAGKVIDKEGERTIASSPQAKSLDGSYAGFQPKPAVEIIIVAMKPLSEKTYVDQALKNGKGITWLDNCKIPYVDGNDKAEAKPQGKSTSKIGALAGKTQNIKERTEFVFTQSGRFPANLLVSDDMLNDGKITKSSGGSGKKSMGALGDNIYGKYNKKTGQHSGGLGDIGSHSRYFDLDAWFSKQMEELSLDIQNTFPFIAVPKASKSEKNEGCGGLPKKLNSKMMRNGNNTSETQSRGFERFGTEPTSNNHPTVKPLKLISYLVVLGSREEDIILDPYIGSGTTGLACKLLNRGYIGFENNIEYHKIAEARLSTDIKKYKKYVDKKLIKKDELENEPPEKDYNAQLTDWIQ